MLPNLVCLAGFDFHKTNTKDSEGLKDFGIYFSNYECARVTA